MTPPPPPAPGERERLTERRASVFDALGDGVMVLAAGPLLFRSRDTEAGYRPDSELYYVTGATEPETVAVLIGGGEPSFVLFVRDRDEEAELWSGPRLGPDAAREHYGADECHPIGRLDAELPALLQRADRIHFRLGRSDRLERLVVDGLVHARLRGARRGSGPRGLVDPGEILDELRLIKDETEIARLRRAAAVTVEGHCAGARRIEPDTGEWVVESVVDGAFRAAGGAGPGFETIVASGANACVLHYVDNQDRIPDGGLVLLDAGAEVALYQGDVTRTYPASGRFDDAQRDVYEVVDAARRSAIEAVLPGARVADVHDAAVRSLTEGLLALGVLDGRLEDLVDEGAHKRYYPHQTSHWLGIDVHDPGDYARGGDSRVLRPGMVFTVEPGLYFRPGLPEGSGHLEGIGIRIEDDVLVTEEGCEVLTAALPTAVADVEGLVGEGA